MANHPSKNNFICRILNNLLKWISDKELIWQDILVISIATLLLGSSLYFSGLTFEGVFILLIFGGILTIIGFIFIKVKEVCRVFFIKAIAPIYTRIFSKAKYLGFLAIAISLIYLIFPSLFSPPVQKKVTRPLVPSKNILNPNPFPITRKTAPDTSTITPPATRLPAKTNSILAQYIGNAHTGKLHVQGCRAERRMDESNRVYFTNRDDAINQGYTPCQICHP